MKKSKQPRTPSRNGARAQLINAARDGGITLVLGAGISMARGIPDWNSLAKAVWEDAFPDKPSPWTSSTGPSPTALSQFLPIIFERVYRERKEAGFIDLLRKHLYAHARLPSKDPDFSKSKESLAVLARLLVAEHRRKGNRRIGSVITFNADNLIEQAVQRVVNPRQTSSTTGSEVVRPIIRSTHRFAGQSSTPVISVYHIHGYLTPADWYGFDSRMLVFTDSQYWSTSASATSFANRVMSTALSEGRCVFIGLSMTDINLLRWLALRNLDRDRDQLSFEQSRLLNWISDRASESDVLLDTVRSYLERGSANPSRALDGHFRRHFWIRPPSTDPSGFLSDFLSYRGIQAVDINSWHDSSFHKLMSECFPLRSRDHPGSL
jgi:SIR2-like domain